MIVPGSRIALCVLILVVLAQPASADELYPTVTDIFFEKDGLPYNESVQFTVSCYGYSCKSWDCQRNSEDLLARNGNFSPELVFSYHATCPQHGCRIFEPYYHAERNFGTYCDMEGITPQGRFTIRNFSPSAIPPDCTDLHQVDMGSFGRYYRITPEYSACINEKRRNAKRCDEYLKACEPEKDDKCGNWVRNGTSVKETPSYRACMDTIDRDRTECNQYLMKIDPATMILWNYSGYRVEPARRACSLWLTIPSKESTTTTIPVSSVRSPESQKSPVESFYCSILGLFGGRC